MNIGTKIKELRNHNKITQEDLLKHYAFLHKP